MQGLTINGSTLYAIVNFHVYSLPLSSENVLSGGRFALFNITHEGLWSDLPWLKLLLNKTMQHFGGWESLLQLNLIPAAKYGSFVKLIHAIYKKAPEEQGSFSFELLSGNVTEALKEVGDKTLTKRYAFFSDGAGHGYVVWNDSGRQVPVFRPGPFANADFSATYDVLSALDYPSYFATISKPGHLTLSSTSDSSSFSKLNHLVSEPENAFGFLFNGTFHYWDLNKRQVILFKDPLTADNHTVRFKTVPMSKYFVCSREQWSTSVPSDDYDIADVADTATSETSTLFAWLVVAILIIGVFILLFTFVMWRICAKEKRTLNINRQESRSPRSRLFLKSLKRAPSSGNSKLMSLSAASLPLAPSSSSHIGIQQHQIGLKSVKVKPTREQMADSTTPSTSATSAFSVDDLRRLDHQAPYKIVVEGEKNVYNMDLNSSSTLPSQTPILTLSDVLKAQSSAGFKRKHNSPDKDYHTKNEK